MESSIITNINLKLLQTFMLVAKHSSFRQAADHANRSQSAVSAQIKELETQLGVALFHRTTRRVRLSLDGERLLGSARRALQDVGATLRQIQDAADVNRGRVSLACSPLIATRRLGSVLAAFERDCPNLRINVRELPSFELLEAVSSGSVDFAVGPVMQAGDLHYEHILDDDLYAMVPKRLMPDPRPDLPLRELAAMPLLLPQPGTIMRSFLHEVLAAHSLVLNTKHQFTLGQSLISMAEAGLGVAILPEYGLPAQRSKDVRIVRIVEPRLSRQVAIISLRGQTLSPTAARLADLIRRHIGKPGLPRPRRRQIALTTVPNAGKHSDQFSR